MWLLANLDSYSNSIDQWAASLGVAGEAFFRLILAGAAGGLVGLEREMRGRQAGFRTNLLVCMGSALTMLVSLHFAGHSWHPQESGVNINIDPARIAYGVMTGIGFLGAGTILQQGGAIRGLTTAAAMWCVAAVCLAFGFGMYLVAAGACAIVLSALWVLGYFEDYFPKYRFRDVIVRRKWQVGCIASTVDYFKKAGFEISDVAFERSSDLQHADINLKVAFSSRRQYFKFERQLECDSDYELIAIRES